MSIPSVPAGSPTPAPDPAPDPVESVLAQLRKAMGDTWATETPVSADESIAILDAVRAVLDPAMAAENARLRQERNEARAGVERLKATDAAYWRAQKVLDEALGEDEDDGMGEGLAADVWLLAQQRDAERERYRQLAGEVAKIADGSDEAAELIVRDEPGLWPELVKDPVLIYRHTAKRLRALAATAPQTAPAERSYSADLDSVAKNMSADVSPAAAPTPADQGPVRETAPRDVRCPTCDSYVARPATVPLLATDTAVRLVGDDRTWRVKYREDYLTLLGSPYVELRLIPAEPSPAVPEQEREPESVGERCTATTSDNGVTLRCEHEAGHEGWHDADLIPPPGRVGWANEADMPLWARTAPDEHLQALRDELDRIWGALGIAKEVDAVHEIRSRRAEQEADQQYIRELIGERDKARREAERLRGAARTLSHLRTDVQRAVDECQQVLDGGEAVPSSFLLGQLLGDARAALAAASPAEVR